MKQRQAVLGRWVLWLAMVAFLPVSGGAGAACAGDELTLPKPIPSCMVRPVYPEQEKAAGVEGTVMLGLQVNSDGKVASVKAEQEVQGHPAFTASALAAVGKWCFEPAHQDGHAVACAIKIPVRFALEEKRKK